MSNVLSFDKNKNKLHASGEARCIDCGHEWIAIVPIPYDSSLECPECKLCRGGLKYPFSPNQKAMVYECNCGCNHFWVVHNGILCVGCGGVTAFSELI